MIFRLRRSGTGKRLATFLGLGLLPIVALVALAQGSTIFAVPLNTATKTDALIIDIDGDGAADPGDTLRYTVVVANSGTSDAIGVAFDDSIDANTTLVLGSVKTTPIARNDLFDSVGNMGITVPDGPSDLLANDNDPDGGTVTANAVTGAATVNGGNITIAADGSFAYDPPAGFEGIDSYIYTVTDDEGMTDAAHVFFTVSGMIWFIDNSFGAAGDGRLNSPFNTLAGFEAVNGNGGASDPAAGDPIFLHETGSGDYTGGVTLENSQLLIGQGATASLATITGITLPPVSNPLPTTSGSRPVIANASGDGIALASGNLIRGLNVGNTSGFGVSGASVGVAAVSEALIGGTGGLLDINTGTLAMSFDSLTSTSSATDGIDLDNVVGSVTISGATSISGAGGNGVSLVGSPGATLNFGSLAISTSSGAGLVATNSGTININDTGTTIDATGGPAVALQNTAGQTNGSGATGWTFASLVSTNSPSDGITLNSLGNDFTVTGNTTITNPDNDGIDVDGSGAAIDYRFGSPSGTGTLTITDPGNASSGDGINLNSVTGSLIITSDGGGIFFSGSNDNNGIQAITSVTGLDLTVEGTGAGIHRFEISGVSAGTGSADGHGIHTRNVDEVTASLVHIHDIAIPNSNDSAMLLEDTRNTVSVTSSRFERIDEGFCVGVLSPSASHDLNVTITGNTFAGEGNLTSPTTGGTPTECVALTFGETNYPSGGSTTGKRVNANISNNTFDAVGRAIGVVVEGDTGTGASGRNMITINNNNIEDLNNDGIDYAMGSSSVSKWVITNNIIDGETGVPGGGPNRGIDLVANVFGGTADVFIEGNTVRDMEDEGIRVHSFIDPLTGLIRVRIANNTLTSAANDQGIHIDAEVGHEIQATVTNNSINYGNDSIRALVDDPITGSNNGILCLNATGNTGPGGTPVGIFDLDDYLGTGGFTSPQTSAAAMSAANGGVTVSASGVVFGAGACTLPVAMRLPGAEPAELFAMRSDDTSIEEDAKTEVSGVTFVSSDVAGSPTPVGTNPGSSWVARTKAELASLHARINDFAGTLKNDLVSSLGVTTAYASGETVNINLGIMNPGQVVTISFDVTVDGSIPSAVTEVCNQGTLSASNLSDVLTDDPDVGGVQDPTCTLVERAVSQQPELWTVDYRWGDPAPGFSFADWPIFKGWMDVSIENRGLGDAFNVTATVTSWPANVTVPDPSVTANNIPAGSSVWSVDTFTTWVDMADPAGSCEEILWRIEYDDSTGVHHVIENVPEFPPGEGPCP